MMGKKNEVPLIMMTNAPLPSGGFAMMLHAKYVLLLKGRNVKGTSKLEVEESKEQLFHMMK